MTGGKQNMYIQGNLKHDHPISDILKKKKKSKEN